MKYYFSIPDFYGNFGVNEKLLNMFEKHPEMINDDVVVESVYGCFPMAIWNGGRFIGGNTGAVNVENTLAYFNNRGVSCRYTFTNCLIEKKHLNDTWCNTLMEIGNNGSNSVIVNSDMLNDYIRKTYPNYSRVSSTTKVIRSIEEFNAECERDFEICVLHYDFNNKFDELKKITYPEKVELVANEYCVPNCRVREAHYELISKGQLGFRNIQFNGCSGRVNSYTDIINRPHYVSYKDIVEKYAPIGINHFKIVGRSAKKERVVESYIQYFIKPEWQTTARLLLMN